MKIKVLLGMIIVLTCGMGIIYIINPPHFLSAFSHKTLNSTGYEKLNTLISNSQENLRLSLSVSGDLLVEGGDEYSSSEKVVIAKLMRETEVYLVGQEKGMVLFHFAEGESKKSHYRVSIVRKKSTYKNDILSCGGYIFNESVEGCIVDIDDHWALYYMWVKLPW